MQLRTILLASCLVGCFAPETSTNTAALDGPKLSIELANDSELAGVFTSYAGELKFTALHGDGDKLSAIVTVNGLDIDLHAYPDDDAIVVGFRINGEILDEDAHALLAGFHAQIAELYPYPVEGDELDVTPPHISLVRSYAGFLSEAPYLAKDREYNDTRIDRETGQPTKPVPPPSQTVTPTATPTQACGDIPDDDGATLLPGCCGGGAPLPWQHDAIAGGTVVHCFITETNFCGNASATSGDKLATSCPGRCGVGCAAFPGYFQDCLDHDLCVQEDAPSGIGGLCNDEFNEAVNDFASAFVMWWGILPWIPKGCN